jgi:putative membrane protein
MTKKNKKSPFGIVLRGLAMGAADVVPGVSGGTIAFITGIYEELLETISNLNFGLLKTWKNDGFKAMWTAGNFNFLLALFTGILISIASLAIFIEFLLATYPIQLWAFFFGLILASIWLVGRTVEKWNLKNVLGLIGGTLLAYYITTMAPSAESSNLLYILLCGSIAICAMILPGISGSFILILLGAYTIVLGAVSGILKAIKASDWTAVMDNGAIIAVFAAGCLIGLISFAKLLNWLFKKSQNLIIAILTGFLIGSLNKIWPWKETISYFVKHKGEVNEELVPLVQKNISPAQYNELMQEPSHIAAAIVFALLGLTLIVAIDQLGKRFAKVKN